MSHTCAHTHAHILVPTSIHYTLFPSRRKENKTTTLVILWLEWQVGISSWGMHAECYACGAAGEWWKERGGEMWEKADGVCLGGRNSVEGGVMARGVGGRGLLLEQGWISGLSTLLQGWQTGGRSYFLHSVWYLLKNAAAWMKNTVDRVVTIMRF